MSYTLEVQHSATLDMHEAYVWYGLRREGLGEEFVEEVEACFAKLTEKSTAPFFSQLSF